MAKRRSESNGNGDKLDEALRSLVLAQALLVQNQAASQAQIAESQRRMAESERQMADYQREAARELAEYRRESAKYQQEAAQRFARIEAILLEHSRILQALPDAVREKIGFKSS